MREKKRRFFVVGAVDGDFQVINLLFAKAFFRVIYRAFREEWSELETV